MRVAVTGARGYLGRALVPALATDSRVDEVVAIDSQPPLRDNRPGVRELQRDVRDPDLADALSGADALVHLAFRVLGRGADAQSVNVDGSRNVFAAALRSGARTLIHASSAAVYGCSADNPTPFREDFPLRAEPPFYYPRTKIEVERMLDDLVARDSGLRVVRMRPVSTLGPGAPAILSRRMFVTISDFDPLMQFTWIDDLVAAFTAALHSPAATGAFNVGAPGPVRSSQVAPLIGVRAVRIPHRVLRSVAHVSSALRLPGAMHPAWVDMARYPIVVDAGRAERELDWRASCDCATALRRYGALVNAPVTDERGVTVVPEEAG